MSENNIVEGVVVDCCANCGTKEIDDIKLTVCDKCDLARYCGDECQQNHREKHEAICKERAADLRNELLFRQPEGSHIGDCPICCLPLPFRDDRKSTMFSCCSNWICIGCTHANVIREMEQNLTSSCPFCRIEVPKTEKENTKMLMKRAEANDPLALRELGLSHCKEGDFDNAYKYCRRAAELGDAEAHNDLSVFYREGEGVEKDEERKMYHCEEAAIAGHPGARYNLGYYEWRHLRLDKAVKHWIIAANLGYDDSIQALKAFYKAGHVSKDDLAAALRAHQAAVDATKSPQRQAAEKLWEEVE